MSKFYILLFQNTIMLSCSLDPDQDLQSGSKLFTGTHYLHGTMYAVRDTGHNPPRTKPPLLIFVYVDKIPPMNFTTRT